MTEWFRGVNEETIGRLVSFSVENAGTIGDLGVFNWVNVGTIEVLGALRVLKLGIIGAVVSCGVYTEGGGILVAFCV